MKTDANGKAMYAGVGDCAKQILAKEGFLSFWSGFTAYYMRTAPHAMIALVSLETFVEKYKSAFGLHKA